jgi:TPR repeat protein
MMHLLAILLLLLTGPALADARSDALTAYKAGDFTTAYRLFGRLAESGDVEAIFYLGAIAHRDGMAVDAARWFCRAAEGGHLGGQHNCAVFSYRGMGTPQRTEDARRWFAAAAARGHLGSAASLGAMLLEGEGGPADPAAGLAWLGWAAAGGQPQALFALANAHELGRGVARDPATALDYFRRAAEAGHPEAQNAFGSFLLHGAYGLKENPAEAARWFRRAAERNSPAGAFNLGTLLWQGRGMPADKVEAYRWFATAGLYGDDAMINRVTGILFQLEEKMTEEELEAAQSAVPDWENRLYRPPATLEDLAQP